MTKDFKAIKASMILGMLLFSMFMMLAPTSSADEIKESGLISISHSVEVTWANEKNASIAIKPLQGSQAYELDIVHTLTKGPFGGGIYSLFYAGQKVDMKVEIENYPHEWTQVTAFADTIDFALPQDLEKETKRTHTLFISVFDNAPAQQEGKIALRITIPKIGMIEGYDKVIELPFRADYLAKLNVLAETQTKVIGPMDTTEIPIKVTNLGNGETIVKFNIPNIPSGWSALVTDQVILSPDQIETVFLTVKPPKGFGYHDDVYTFRVEYTPVWSIDQSLKGETDQVTVSVESRGISLIGFEVVLPIILLLIVVIYLIYYFMRKRQK
jgi:hypothetical protein